MFQNSAIVLDDKGNKLNREIGYFLQKQES